MAGLLGKLAPGVAETLDGMTIDVGGAPVDSIPIALCLFFMMFPILLKIDFGEVVRAGTSIKPVGLTLFVDWAVKPFTMYAIVNFLRRRGGDCPLSSKSTPPLCRVDP